MARTHVALLRGINLGGRNSLPMADLRRLATGLGWQDLKTYVASGNLVFSAEGATADLEAALAAAVEQHMGKPIQTLVVEAADWVAAVEACPFTPEDERFVHVQVHRRAVSGEVAERVRTLIASAEDDTEVHLDGRWAYVHTPRGLSQSVAFTKLPPLLPKDDPGTARNLKSAKAIAALLTA